MGGGGDEFTSSELKDFLVRWGTKHRLSSAYFPQSNGRGEVAVKATKRLLETNVAPDASVDTDNVVRALLHVRNTPDRDCKRSPAEILFGHPLKDTIPHIDKSVPIFAHSQFNTRWHNAWKAKEEAIHVRMGRRAEDMFDKGKAFDPLCEGDMVFVQNQVPSSRSPR